MQSINFTVDGMNHYLMNQMGVYLANNRQDLIDLLDSSDIDIDESASDVDIINAYVDNLPTNDGLKLASAYLVNLKDESNFNGTVNNESIYRIYDGVYDYWNEDDDFSNAGGWGAAVNKAVEMTKTAVENRRQKKNAASNYAQKSAESKAQMANALMAQKQAQLDAAQKEKDRKAKIRKVAIVSGVSLIAVVAIVGVVLHFKNKKK